MAGLIWAHLGKNLADIGKEQGRQAFKLELMRLDEEKELRLDAIRRERNLEDVPRMAQAEAQAAPIRAEGTAAAAPIVARGEAAAAPIRAEGVAAAAPIVARGEAAAAPIRAEGTAAAAPIVARGEAAAAPIKAEGTAAAAPIVARGEAEALKGQMADPGYTTALTKKADASESTSTRESRAAQVKQIDAQIKKYEADIRKIDNDILVGNVTGANRDRLTTIVNSTNTMLRGLYDNKPSSSQKQALDDWQRQVDLAMGLRTRALEALDQNMNDRSSAPGPRREPSAPAPAPTRPSAPAAPPGQSSANRPALGSFYLTQPK
jgi:hypothetical protein